MNAPLFNREVQACPGWLRVFAFFHLNLAFSSIEEERRGEVIERCYWPLLGLAERHAHIGIEVSGYTLEEIAARDPTWIVKARELVAANQVTLIGSGYSQMIGPLVPARVMQENLRIGNEVYRALLGVQPTIALVNEQAYSAGLVSNYLDAGYTAILMDWDNPSAHNPQWNPELQYLPQRAQGADGRTIQVLWTNTAAFQQLQRYVHGDTSLETYLRFVRGRRSMGTRALCLYASDAEIFDFRPGRFKTESKLSEFSEWGRLHQALTGVRSEIGINLIGPQHVLKLADREGGGQVLNLETPACPVPVKKQRKYNLARWAVTGRDNTAINAACERIYRGMVARDASPADWKELCYLWASDFRTHLTESRWADLCARLEAAEAQWSRPQTAAVTVPANAEAVETRHLNVQTSHVYARLDRRRGMAIERLRFGEHSHALVGGLAHGHFDEISLQADWYTGHSVFEAAGEHKVTDLEWCDATSWTTGNGDRFIRACTETSKGMIEKIMRFAASEPRVDFDLTFHWDDWGKGVLRLGHFTLLPDAFDPDLTFTTHNGGSVAETFQLSGQRVEYGAPVSFLVSSGQGLGMTEGWAEIGDRTARLRIEVDRETAPLLGLVTHIETARGAFCRFMLSAL
ncbi:MAG: glycoside hydrolase family 57, partial [Alphaproteobacteria bacterium]|nr:glycoside hydrolase family 57 [Alphaproteobacteria bacterium]